MTTLQDYIYEEVLMKELSLNKISTKLGKIILQLYNTISKMEDGEKYDKYLQILKHMRVEMLSIEKKYYNKEITLERMKEYFSSYIKGLLKIKKVFSEIDDKKIKRVVEKIDSLIDKLKHLKEIM